MSLLVNYHGKYRSRQIKYLENLIYFNFVETIFFGKMYTLQTDVHGEKKRIYKDRPF